MRRNRLGLFRVRSPQAARLLRAAQPQPMRRGQVLFRQGAPARTVWVVLEGWVHLVCAKSPGADRRGLVVLTVTPREGLCGVSGLIGKRYVATAVAATDGRILCVPAQVFRDALEADPSLTRAVLRLCCERIRRMAEHYGETALPVPRRVARAVLRLREQFGDSIPVTHRELAQMTCTTTESAIRTIRQFKAEGLCTGRRGEVTVRNPRGLQRVAEERPEGTGGAR